MRSRNNQVLALDIDSVDPDSLVWEARQEFPGGGRHHPITFANATHGFVLTGSTSEESYTSDFWVYEEATDSWTNLTETDSAFPGAPRSYGYGVASTTDCENPKAYLGFGASEIYPNDWWEFDMSTHDWRQLADFPGEGRKHPSMNFLEPVGEIHIGLGNNKYSNLNDYWAYNIERDEWRQLEDFPSTERHHPFYFAIGADSYVGLGHSSGIERDWYRYDALSETWNQEADFASYALGTLDTSIQPGRLSSDVLPVTTEARVAGTQFSVAGSCDSDQALGFVLSGDGNDHSFMATGEFHVFDPAFDASIWHSLPPHPGFSRWAPGSFVLQGSSRVYLIGGYDRHEREFFSNLWTINLEPLFDSKSSALDSLEQNTVPELENADASSSAITPRSSQDGNLSVIVAMSFLALVL